VLSLFPARARSLSASHTHIHEHTGAHRLIQAFARRNIRRRVFQRHSAVIQLQASIRRAGVILTHTYTYPPTQHTLNIHTCTHTLTHMYCGSSAHPPIFKRLSARCLAFTYTHVYTVYLCDSRLMCVRCLLCVSCVSLACLCLSRVQAAWHGWRGQRHW